MPRSGTTSGRRTLGSDPQVALGIEVGSASEIFTTRGKREKKKAEWGVKVGSAGMFAC